MDLSTAIIPKSDQLNADDLIAGPRTIRISRVEVRITGEQPVSIFYDGDNGKPWKPCKGMIRALVFAWGADSTAYAGRRARLMLDPKVKWAGAEVGGIRVSHLSHLPGNAASITFAQTVAKGSKKVVTIAALQNEDPITHVEPPVFDRAGALAKLEAAALKGVEALKAEWEATKGRKALESELPRLKQAATEADAGGSQP
jgi:hypothetical protein